MDEIEQQCELIRSLKAKKAPIAEVECQVLELLKLKAYKNGYFIAPIVQKGLLILDFNCIINVNEQTSFRFKKTNFLISEESGKNNIMIIVHQFKGLHSYFMPMILIPNAIYTVDNISLVWVPLI